MSRAELQPAVVVRGALAALLAGLAGLLVVGLAFGLLLGDAGAGWDDPSGRVLLWLSLHVVVLLAGMAAGAAGTWQAAEAGAASRREAVMAGAALPAALALVVTLLVELSVASFVSGLVIALGAAVGGALLARRLG